MNFSPTSKKAALVLLFATSCVVAAADRVEFKVVDRIKFSVPGDWPVIANKSTAEKTVFGFQIPNPGDTGTSDSSNLSIVASYLKDAQDRDAFQQKASSTDRKAEEKKLVEGWRCTTFSAMQGSTQYTLWDCYRFVAECGVSVRIAWPHLPKNPPDYDDQMGKVLSDFLVGVGPYKQGSR
jgi:hypothetical protein